MESKTLFPIAKITKAFGFKGEVALQPLIRQCDNYLFKKQISIGLNEKSVRGVSIIKTSGSKKKKLLFSGLKSRDDARLIIGNYIFVHLSIGDPLNMISPKLIGARISDENNGYIGQLISMISHPGHDIYVVLANNKELLIPVVPEIVKNIDHTNKEIVISKMSGLLN
tara:strand:- start:232 stop:735 length:504 start_codon:yes stop_codon:yes gene_type:complete